MQIIDFLSDPTLWNKADVLSPLAGKLIHNLPAGDTQKEILTSLKDQFCISQSMHFDAKEEIQQILKNASNELQRHFNIRDVTVFIMGIDNSEKFVNQNLGGVRGYAWPKVVLLYLNPSRNWQSELFRTTLHELNHCQRYVWSDPYHTFLDWLIFEGLAEAFESEVSGISNNENVKDQTVALFLPQMEKFWNTMPSDAGDWFAGNINRNLPVGLGYHIGHFLEKNFKSRNPTLKWSELIKIPSTEFVTSF